MTKEQLNKRSEELSRMKEKIIELWKADDKVLALQLSRSIMTDKQVLEFCTESYEINGHYSSRPWHKLKLDVDNHYFYLGGDGWIQHNTTFYNNTFPPKNDKCTLASFRKFLNKVCTNKRPRKSKEV
jgi:hypothetical protein